MQKNFSGIADMVGLPSAMFVVDVNHEKIAVAEAQAAAAKAPPTKVNVSPELDVVKKSKGPVMTVLDEFYKVGPGPSSSHTIGPMRITYDFYQRCTKLPADQLAQATGLKVHLYGSLSATGKGHGSDKAVLLGLAVDYAVVHYQEALAHPRLSVPERLWPLFPARASWEPAPSCL